MDSKAIFRVDIGMGPARVLVKRPCPLGLPESLTVAHILMCVHLLHIYIYI